MFIDPEEDDPPGQMVPVRRGRRPSSSAARYINGRIARHSRFMFTLPFDETRMDNDVPPLKLPQCASYLCGQWEIGPVRGKPHFQGLIITNRPMSTDGVMGAFHFRHAHVIHATDGDLELYYYPDKGGTAVIDRDGNRTWYEIGEMPPLNAVAGLQEIKAAIDNDPEPNWINYADNPRFFGTVIRNHAGIARYITAKRKPKPRHDMTNWFISGTTGHGKSSFVRLLFGEETVYAKFDKVGSFDGLEPYHKVLLLEDFRPTGEPGAPARETISEMLRLLDRYAISGNVKYDRVPLNVDHTVITTNRSFEEFWAKENPQDLAAFRRRFHIVLRFIGPGKFRIERNTKEPHLEGHICSFELPPAPFHLTDETGTQLEQQLDTHNNIFPHQHRNEVVPVLRAPHHHIQWQPMMMENPTDDLLTDPDTEPTHLVRREHAFSESLPMIDEETQAHSPSPRR